MSDEKTTNQTITHIVKTAKKKNVTSKNLEKLLIYLNANKKPNT